MADDRTQQQEQQEKLGTKVTYKDPEKSGKPIEMQDITFFPGEATDLKDFLPEEKAKQLAQKLSQNVFFQVEGGPDHQKEIENRQKRQQEMAQKRQEAMQRQMQKMSPAQQEQLGAGQEPPPDVPTPDQPKLERELPPQQRPPQPPKK